MPKDPWISAALPSPAVPQVLDEAGVPPLRAAVVPVLACDAQAGSARARSIRQQEQNGGWLVRPGHAAEDVRVTWLS